MFKKEEKIDLNPKDNFYTLGNICLHKKTGIIYEMVGNTGIPIMLPKPDISKDKCTVSHIKAGSISATGVGSIYLEENKMEENKMVKNQTRIRLVHEDGPMQSSDHKNVSWIVGKYKCELNEEQLLEYKEGKIFHTSRGLPFFSKNYYEKLSQNDPLKTYHELVRQKQGLPIGTFMNTDVTQDGLDAILCVALYSDMKKEEAVKVNSALNELRIKKAQIQTILEAEKQASNIKEIINCNESIKTEFRISSEKAFEESQIVTLQKIERLETMYKKVYNDYINTKRKIEQECTFEYELNAIMTLTIRDQINRGNLPEWIGQEKQFVAAKIRRHLSNQTKQSQYMMISGVFPNFIIENGRVKKWDLFPKMEYGLKTCKRKMVCRSLN